MSNTMKLCIRTGIILVLMIIINWLKGAITMNDGLFSTLPHYVRTILIYLPYFLMGITAGTMVSPRFANKKKNWVYMIPTVLFLILALSPYLAPLIPVAIIGKAVLYFGSLVPLSWVLVGLFASQSFR